jgi:hypothetical protein
VVTGLWDSWADDAFIRWANLIRVKPVIFAFRLKRRNEGNSVCSAGVGKAVALLRFEPPKSPLRSLRI